MTAEGAFLRRHLEAYTTSCDEFDDWQLKHAEAMQCFHMESLIQAGLAYFSLIDGANSVWRRHVARGERAADPAIDDEFKVLFAAWRTSTAHLTAAAAEYTAKGYDVVGLDRLHATVAEVEARLARWTLAAPSTLPTHRTVHGAPTAAAKLKELAEQAAEATSLDLRRA